MNQVKELNKKVILKVAPSKIHGVGVFALKDIKKGQRLYADDFPKLYDLSYSLFNQLDKESAEEIAQLEPFVATDKKFAWPVVRYQAFMNHSDKPNYDNNLDIALSNIKKGEEITEDYRTIEGAEIVFPWLNK